MMTSRTNQAKAFLRRYPGNVAYIAIRGALVIAVVIALFGVIGAPMIIGLAYVGGFPGPEQTLQLWAILIGQLAWFVLLFAAVETLEEMGGSA